MEVNATTMRVLLGLCLLGMQLMAVFYLRRRRLTFMQYLGWGLLIGLVPALGPFLAILLRPGKPAVRIIRRVGSSSRSLPKPIDLIRQFALRIRLTKP